MNFSDIVGQESIKEQLQGAISTGRVSHAYILYGEVRSGKEFVAKVFAQSLLCEKPVTKQDGTSFLPAGDDRQSSGYHICTEYHRCGRDP